ncbi:hypothetical protein QTG54_011159 [Skeletonema marinoi]|uniref:Leucine-rich repeat domain-containing protein n=1 Tax=Skeletonema marinoi TaxID=267567 RepID=A0AAD9D9K2_9STRA|nr:hypothetical protein QTG54_011159 [Skeletonema marinoi]
MADVDDNVFVYLGGDQVVPQDVTHVIIDRSVIIILRGAFQGRRQLVSVKMHVGIEKIEEDAFYGCTSLRKINLKGVREIEADAFYSCRALADVEFGTKLDRIGQEAFDNCKSLRKIKMPSVRTVEVRAFVNCTALTDAEFGCNLETIEQRAFYLCPNLRRIAVPLKDDIFPASEDPQNYILLAPGELAKTEMIAEINRINQMLPINAPSTKSDTIRWWIITVINRMEHYKAEHCRLLNEDMTLLELAVWKAKLDEKEVDYFNKKVLAKKAKIDVESARKERHITSGADIIIRNVLRFLRLWE